MVNASVVLAQESDQPDLLEAPGHRLVTHSEETAHASNQSLVELLGPDGSPDALFGRQECDRERIGTMFRGTLLRLA